MISITEKSKIAQSAKFINIDEAPVWNASKNNGGNYYEFYAYKERGVWQIFGHFQFQNCAPIKYVFRSQKVYSNELIYLGTETYKAIKIDAVTRSFWDRPQGLKTYYMPCAILGEISEDLTQEKISEIAREFFADEFTEIIAIYFQPESKNFTESLWDVSVTGEVSQNFI